MPNPKSNFAAAILEGAIYVIGGFNGTTTVSLVERYDIESRKWFIVPEMPTRISACSAAVIEDVANPDAWI